MRMKPVAGRSPQNIFVATAERRAPWAGSSSGASASAPGVSTSMAAARHWWRMTSICISAAAGVEPHFEEEEEETGAP